MLEKPKFIQGVYPFEGRGLETPAAFDPQVVYKVPFDKRSQLIYLRAGNSCAEMIYLLLKRDGKPMRYFPIAAKGAMHVPLAVVEDILPDSVVEVLLAAPNGVKGTVLLDIGLVEI
ncbi:MAG: molybdopterin oxidoreductase [Acidobacteriota bacterium]|nr:molybdopterin oxidoreductase [Acidobacteriota bacterium]